jgi:anti-sigma B factor antagonist
MASRDGYDPRVSRERGEGCETDEMALPILRVAAMRVGVQAVVTLEGDIDMSTADTFRAAAADCLGERPARLSIDLSALTFCDCAGVRALQRARCEAAAGDVEFQILAPSGWVRRLFAMAGADDLLAASTGTAGR